MTDDDMTMLRTFGAGLDPSGDGPPPALRGRVTSPWQHVATGSPPRISVARRSWAVSSGRGLVTAGLLVVMATVGLVTANGNQADPPAATRVAKPPGTIQLGGSEVLLRAAHTARTDGSPPPRPDQFVYVQTVVRAVGVLIRTNDAPHRQVRPQLRKAWLSVDGTRDGFLTQAPYGEEADAAPPSPPISETLPGCRGGRAARSHAPDAPLAGAIERCEPRPAYRPELPTDVDAMLTFLRSEEQRSETELATKGVRSTVDHGAFLVGSLLISETYLTSAQRGALFEALSRLDGVTVVPDVVDVAGRHGIAVAMLRELSKQAPRLPVLGHQLIFDPTTFAYLGDRREVTIDRGQPAVDGGGSAVQRVAIVDRARQSP